MTPLPQGVAPITPSADTTGVFGAALIPITDVQPHLPGLPVPDEARKTLIGRIEEAVLTARRDRGAVHMPEDVHPLVRSLTKWRDLAKKYATAFTAVAKRIDGILEEELVEAVGADAHGIAAGSLSVPLTDGGKVRVSQKTENVYSIDQHQVVACLVAQMIDRWETRQVHEPDTGMAPSEDPAGFAIECVMHTLAMMGAQTMKVTQVRELADELGRQGLDQLAGAVRTAIRCDRKSKGIDVVDAA